MCYEIYLSTTSSEDFSHLQPRLLMFATVRSEDEADVVNVLKYPNRWYLTREYGGCSCNFRHESAMNTVQEFGVPEDWRPEDEEDLQATAEVFHLFRQIVDKNYKLDVVDAWSGADLGVIRSLDISLSTVSADEFRFFENWRFDFMR